MEECVIKVLKEIYRLGRDIVLIPHNISVIKQLVNGISYYPEKERKSKSLRWFENLKYLLKNREANIYYNSYGLDVKNFRNAKDFISHRKFVLAREQGNQRKLKSQTGSYNYITLLRDKYLFSAYLQTTLGSKYIPETIGIINKGDIYLVGAKKWVLPKDFFSGTFTYVFKKIDGECADGVSLVRLSEEKVYHDEIEENWQEFYQSIINSRILVQKVLIQHDSLKYLNPSCVNTIRIVTLANGKREIGVFSAFLRLGVTENSFVDNRAKGGLGVGINLKTGCLKKYGFAHDAFGTKTKVHPVTKVEFEDYQIPYWKEVIELVINAHKQFYELQSIGWDIVITPNGPVILEGNDDWEIGGPQDTGGGLKKEWIALTGTRI